MKRSSPGTPLNYHSYTCILAVSLAVKCAGIRMAHSQKVNIIIPRSRNCALSVRDHTGVVLRLAIRRAHSQKVNIIIPGSRKIVRSPYAITLALFFAFRYSSSLFARGRHRARFVYATFLRPLFVACSFSSGTFSKVRAGGRPLPLYHYSPNAKTFGS